MALILCTGVDQSLMETRKLLLEYAGHSVVTASGEREITAACQQHKFDVAVIGQVITPKAKRSFAALIRKHSAAKILELYLPFEGKLLTDADAWLEVPARIPQDLAEHVGQLAAMGKGTA